MADKPRAGSIVSGLTLTEPNEVLTRLLVGMSVKVTNRGWSTGMPHDPLLTLAQPAQLTISADHGRFDGDAHTFRLDAEAQRLGLA